MSFAVDTAVLNATPLVLSPQQRERFLVPFLASLEWTEPQVGEEARRFISLCHVFVEQGSHAQFIGGAIGGSFWVWSDRIRDSTTRSIKNILNCPY